MTWLICRREVFCGLSWDNSRLPCFSIHHPASHSDAQSHNFLFWNQTNDRIRLPCNYTLPKFFQISKLGELVSLENLVDHNRDSLGEFALAIHRYFRNAWQGKLSALFLEICYWIKKVNTPFANMWPGNLISDSTFFPQSALKVVSLFCGKTTKFHFLQSNGILWV